jgi:hypothetical protein
MEAISSGGVSDRGFFLKKLILSLSLKAGERGRSTW